MVSFKNETITHLGFNERNQIMATYSISTLYKKSSEERSFWFKDKMTAIKTEGYRWGTFTKECDEHPDIDLDNEDGYEVYGDEWELVDLSDGCWGDWEWPEDMPEEERERLQTLWEEEWYEGLEGEGWTQDETEVWLYGPLLLKNEDSGEEWRGADMSFGVSGSVASTVVEDEPAPELTEWFPADVNPVREGQYEVRTGNQTATWPFPSYADWDGKTWIQNEKVVTDLLNWRGLANDPQK